VVISLKFFDCQFHKLDSAIVKQNNETAFALRGDGTILICCDSFHSIAPYIIYKESKLKVLNLWGDD
jgi:hypothetical protein